MAVLIDMEMPKDCPQCPMSHWNKLDVLTGCEIINRYVPDTDTEYWQSNTRPDWCPLREIKLPKRDPDAEKLLKEAGWE